MSRRGFWVPMFALAACTAPGLDHVSATTTAPPTTGSTTTPDDATSMDELPTSGEMLTTTGEPDPGGPDESDTAEDPDLPQVIDAVFDPDPLKQLGTIAVTVVVKSAAGVRMQLEGADPIELTRGPGGDYLGQVDVLSGLANGTHDAWFTAWQGEVQSAPRLESYTVTLPEAGEDVLWDTLPLLGPGEIEALAFLPENHVIALGTRQQGESRCFVHRRDLKGNYGAADIVDIHPDQHCTATDVRVAPDGTIYLLATVTGGDGPRWRLATMQWGDAPVVVRTGAKDEVAHALALGPGDAILVCGAGPSGMGDLDARVWGMQGAPQSFDYRPDEFENHTFDETIRDCDQAGDDLVMIGDAFGLHDTEDMLMPARTRMFLLEREPDPSEPVWTVPAPGPGDTQSWAKALAIDEQGRYIIGLYVCGDMCSPAAELRIYEPGGTITEWMPLAPNVLPPEDLAWNSAGYVVIASAQIVDGWSTRFLLEAYIPGTYEPAWTYKKALIPSTHIAKAVVVTPSVVVGAGVGGEGLPAFAFVNP